MLRGIHKASSNWLGRIVMGVLLGLIAISFGIWGIGDIFRGFGQSTVAKVGKTEIRVEQFRQLYQDRLQQLSRSVGRPVTLEQARALGVDRQLLAQMIAESLLDERARALGLGLNDAEVARRVMEDPAFRGLSGQFDRARFEYVIRQLGYNEARFLAEHRRNLLRQQIVGTIGGEFPLPKTAADALNRYQNEQRTIEYVVLDRAQAGDIPDPTPEVLTKYFEDRKILFRAPEYRKVQYFTLTPAEVAASIELSDADLKRTYEERKARYSTPERRQLRQIAFPNLDEARAAADKIAKGMTFAALAAELGLKDADIDIGTFAQAGMVDRAVAEAAFKLKEGEVSAPVEGRFGPVLVNVVKVEPAHTRTLDEVAAELKQDIAAERARSELNSIHDKIEDERLSGTPFPELAKKFNLQLRTIDAIDRSGQDQAGKTVEGLPQGVDLLNAAFTASRGGDDHDPLTIPQSGGYVWYDVVDITPARERTFDEVKDQIETRWRNDQIAARLKAKADEMLEKLKGGASLAEVAGAHNLKPEWRPGLRRGTPPPGFSARALEEVFRTPKDAVATIEGGANDRYVFRVTEITAPPLNLESAEGKQLDERLRRAMSDDLLSQYVSKLESEIGVTINQAALNQITGASAAN